MCYINPRFTYFRIAAVIGSLW